MQDKDRTSNEKMGEEGPKKRKRIRIMPVNTNINYHNKTDVEQRNKTRDFNQGAERPASYENRERGEHSSRGNKRINPLQINKNRSFEFDSKRRNYNENRLSHYDENYNRNEKDGQNQTRKTYARNNEGNRMNRSYPNSKNYTDNLQSGNSTHKHIVKKLTKPVKFRENFDPKKEVRLNKYLANSGICSRREADSLILAGNVKVNGEVITELGYKVTYADEVKFNDRVISPESKVYVLLNKPKNCVTTSDDPENRMTVMDLVKNACPERIYPVGRLDRNTTGVLLLTNDGDLASKLTHPKYKKKKIYQVTLDRDVAMEDMQAIADGIMLDDGEIHADSIAYVSEDRLNEVGIEIHSGRNRLVRRIFEKLNYKVFKLDRVYFSGLTKKNLPRGKWRYLTPEEVNILRMGAFE